MLPLAAGLTIDLHLVGCLITGQAWASRAAAVALSVGFVLLWFWFGFPGGMRHEAPASARLSEFPQQRAQRAFAGLGHAARTNDHAEAYAVDQP
jgi:hypothetical protein